jgi:hypothetical protein
MRRYDPVTNESRTAMSTPPADVAAPAAVAAFLRGVERRAALFAELQAGDATVGDAALAATMRAFRAGAAATPLGDWPARFWTLLLAAPPLRRDAPLADWPPAWRRLAGLRPGLRAALLLRLAAGLEPATAAAVLGVSIDQYRRALARAVPPRAGAPDAAEWQALDAAVQQQLRHLPAQRLAHLARLRERALAEQVRGDARVRARGDGRGDDNGPRAPRWVRVLLWLALAGCIAAFAATFVLPAGADTGPRARQEALPPAAPPRQRFDAAFAALSEPDFDLLGDPAGAAQAEALALAAWYAAERAALAPAVEVQQPAVEVQPSAPNAVFADTPASPAAASVLPATQRDALARRRAQWAAWTADQRMAWERRRTEWLALPRDERRARRERFARWHALDPAERAQVSAASMAWGLLPLEERRALHARFAALDLGTQRGWLLGPALGADYPRLQPLLAQVPAAQHAPLLAALRGMTPQERADLGLLAQRVPPQGRDELRRGLVSTSEANRAAWLQQQLAR